MWRIRTLNTAGRSVNGVVTLENSLTVPQLVMQSYNYPATPLLGIQYVPKRNESIHTELYWTITYGSRWTATGFIHFGFVHLVTEANTFKGHHRNFQFGFPFHI